VGSCLSVYPPLKLSVYDMEMFHPFHTLHFLQTTLVRYLDTMYLSSLTSKSRALRRLFMCSSKVKLSWCLIEHCDIKTHGVVVKPHVFLNFGTRSKWVVSFLPLSLYRRKSTFLTGGLQDRSGCFGEEKTPCYAKNRTPICRPSEPYPSGTRL
jgi:hypothetical protein